MSGARITRHMVRRTDSGAIRAVKRGTPADRAGLKPGDVLISINGRTITDYLAYAYACADDMLDIVYERDGEKRTARCRGGRAIGLTFYGNIFDGVKQCRNNCVFCFIAQNPPHLRRTLYVRDDDYRLSCMQGNYITLTNLSESDIRRITDERLPRINVSVHATDPQVRAKLLRNPNADCLPILRRFAEAGVEMHCQIVLCRGINDGDALTRTLHDLSALYPHVPSVSVVPSGVTRHRDGLYPLEPFDPAYAADVIRTVEQVAAHNVAAHGEPIVYAADELYLQAGIPLPSAAHYGAFPQIENGVGLAPLFLQQAEDAKANGVRQSSKRIAVITGMAMYEPLTRLLHEYANVQVIGVRNAFFGESVTVAGLLTAADVIAALDGVAADVALLSAAMFNDDGLTLDGCTVDDIAEGCGVAVQVVAVDGAALMETIHL